MEQRIDPNSQPVLAAGTDPGYVPGLMIPRPAGDSASEKEAEPSTRQESDDAVPERGEPDGAAGETAPDKEPSAAGSPADGTDRDDAEAADAPETAGASGTPADEDEAEGVTFEVSDRRASILVDRYGVHFTLDSEAAEFRWDELGAVEIETPRFGRRFTVTVHTTTRRRYQVDVDAPARSSLKSWESELDAVLDTYFEDA